MRFYFGGPLGISSSWPESAGLSEERAGKKARFGWWKTMEEGMELFLRRRMDREKSGIYSEFSHWI